MVKKGKGLSVEVSDSSTVIVFGMFSCLTCGDHQPSAVKMVFVESYCNEIVFCAVINERESWVT